MSVLHHHQHGHTLGTLGFVMLLLSAAGIWAMNAILFAGVATR